MINQIPPVYVISLQRSQSRRQTLVNQLKKAEIDFQLVKGVDGSLLSKHQLASYQHDLRDYYKRHPIPEVMQNRQTLLPTEIGCALSHIKIYQSIVNKGIPYAIILEDDVILMDDIKSIFNSYYAWPSEWHIIFLDYIYLGPPSIFNRQGSLLSLWRYADRIRLGDTGHRLSLNDYYFSNPASYHRYEAPLRLWQRISIDSQHHLAKSIYKLSGSHAYAISYKGAQHLLQHVFPIRLPADTLLTEMDEVWRRTFVITPRPIGLNAKLQTTSTIGEMLRGHRVQTIWKTLIAKRLPHITSYIRFFITLIRMVPMFFRQLIPVSYSKAIDQVSTATDQMPVYLISLRQDKLRRRPLMDQLKCAGISYQLVEAIDGTRISKAHIMQYNREEQSILATVTVLSLLVY